MDWRDWDALRTARSREWDFGSVYEAVTAKKWWLIGLPLAALRSCGWPALPATAAL